LRSLSRAAKAGCLRAVNVSTKGKAKRMMENFNREIIREIFMPAPRRNRYARQKRAPPGRLPASSPVRDYTPGMIVN
jgi:hypothetical protein